MFKQGFHIFIDGNTALVNVKAQRTVDNKVELIQINPVDEIRYEVGGKDVTLESPIYTEPVECSFIRFAGVKNGRLLEKVLFFNSEPTLVFRIIDNPDRKLYGVVSILSNIKTELALDTSSLTYYNRPVNFPISRQVMGYHEINFGVYVLPIPSEMLTIDGKYIFNVLETNKFSEYIKVGGTTVITVKNSEVINDSFISKVDINHDFERPDTLTYVAPGGTPISGATVKVYKKSSYDAGLLNNPIGITETDANGRWKTAISVEAGETYYVVFQKIDPDQSYGPDKVEIIVNYGSQTSGQGGQPPPPPPSPPSGTRIHNEIIEGIDGVNRYFATKYAFAQSTLEVVLNGLSLIPGTDYEIVDNQHFLMMYAPVIGDILSVDYTVL